MTQRHDVVIIGGGNAGISLAGRLRRQGCEDVVVIAPGPLHTYRPLLNYVAGGQVSLSRLSKPMADVIPSGVRWVPDTAVGLDLSMREVELAAGGRIAYEDVVVCSGLEPDLDAIPGLADAMDHGFSSTAHLFSSAEPTWEAISEIRGGTVVFTVPPEPAPCGGTALKPLFLAADHWRESGVLEQVDLHLVTPYREVLDLPFIEPHLEEAVRRFGVTVHHQSTVTRVDHSRRSLEMTGPRGTETLAGIERAFVVPPYRGPGWLAPLAAHRTPGLADVDPATFVHRREPHVWSIGDVASVNTRPSGGALRRQVEILADNIRLSRTGRQLRQYDGYTIIPITLDRRRLLLAEFDRNGTPQPTVRWPDLTTPRRLLWAFDRYVEPVVYFRALLKGRV